MPCTRDRARDPQREAEWDRTEFRVKGAKNLVLRITPSGRKTWAFLYASPSSGRRRKLSLGTYPATGLLRPARKRWRSRSRFGPADPLTQRHIEEAGETFAKLAQRYLAEHERRNARAADAANRQTRPSACSAWISYPFSDPTAHISEALGGRKV